MQHPGQPLPRRSCLSVPGSSEAKLRKATGLAADEVVIDLEDSVAPAHKSDALAGVLVALRSWPADGPGVSVRINATRSQWCHAELAALAAAPDVLKSVVVPKVESAGDLEFVDRLLDGAELAAGRTVPLAVQALIETGPGLAALHEIVTASPRLTSLILGYADLAASLGRPPSATTDLDLWLGAQHGVLVAARSADLQAIDGPFLGIADDESFRAAAARARDLGYDGKWAIHPAQVAGLTALFTPTDAEIEHAHAVIEALSRSETEDGDGAVQLNGQMLDAAVRQAALRTLARARAGQLAAGRAVSR